MVILLLLLQTGFAWARPKVADAGPEAALQSFIQAFDNLDWDRFRSFFADDATVFYPRGFLRRAQGRAEIEANFQQAFAQIRGDRTQPPYMDLRPTDLYLQRFGDMAIATFHLDDKPGFLNRRTIVLHKMTDGWKIVHLHASEGTTAAKPASAQELIKAYPATNWTVLDNPEDAGWSSSKLKLARQYADSIQSAAVMIVQGGWSLISGATQQRSSIRIPYARACLARSTASTSTRRRLTSPRQRLRAETDVAEGYRVRTPHRGGCCR